jgi:dTDP-4-dehydrorhamnose reductase|tara:strand:- start:307 stop:1137 length:831 start_codon:yes stop_codon:yes gene_type:complete
MYYIIGSEGFLGQKIQSIISKNKFVKISTSGKKGTIKNNTIITKKISYKILPNWIRTIKNTDTVILLSNPGSIAFYENNKKKIKFFEENLENNFFSKIDKKTKIIFFSSDMVFPGNKKYFSDSSKPLAINNYGKSKIRIEKKIKKYFKNYIIIRYPKIYSKNAKDKTIYFEIKEALKKNIYLSLFTNQLVHYLNLRDFINGFKAIIKNIDNLNGTFNFPANLFTSRYLFAKKIVNKNIHTKYLIPIKLDSKFKHLPKRLKMKTYLFKKIKFKPLFK